MGSAPLTALDPNVLACLCATKGLCMALVETPTAEYPSFSWRAASSTLHSGGGPILRLQQMADETQC
jgi:hypothetical protein